MIVFDDANTNQAFAQLIVLRWRHAGQACISSDRFVCAFFRADLGGFPLFSFPKFGCRLAPCQGDRQDKQQLFVIAIISSCKHLRFRAVVHLGLIVRIVHFGMLHTNKGLFDR